MSISSVSTTNQGQPISSQTEQLLLDLHTAVQRDQPEKLKSLLAQQTPNMEGRDGDGCTLLLSAAKRGFPDCVNILLKKGAYVNAIHPKGEGSALCIAVQNGRADIVSLLLQYKANPNIKTADEHAPLGIAAKLAYQKYMEYQADPNIKTADEHAPLEIAATLDCLKCMEYLLEKSIALDTNEKNGSLDMTALHYAAMAGNIHITLLLLHHKANPKIENSTGYTPLGLAIEYGHADCVEFLLKASSVAVHVNEYHGPGKQTALHLAVQGQQLASSSQRLKIVHHLLEHGANVTARNAHNQTPIDLVAKDGDNSLDFLEQFIEALPHDKHARRTALATPLCTTARSGSAQSVDMLLRAGADINLWGGCNLEKNTPLHDAALAGHGHIVSLLLKQDNVYSEAQNFQGNTPLHLAAKKGHTSVVTQLLDQKVNPELINVQKKQPLDLAREENQFECVKLLVKAMRESREKREKRR